MAYDWGQHVPEPEPTTWDIPSPLSQKKPGYEYPENYTGFDAPAPSFNPWKEKETQAPATSGYGGGASRWTVPAKLTSTTGTTTGTTMPIKPGIPRPTFTLPERDEGRVKELRTEALSTPMRSMRQEARRALSRIGNMEGPASKEAYRGWTEGLGTGISSIASSASLQAEQLYGVERGEEINAMLANYQAEMNDYMAQYGQTTTTKYNYGGSGDGDDTYIQRNSFGQGMWEVRKPSMPDWWRE